MIGLLRQVQGWVKLKGDTDGTKIGNIGDQLKVTLDTGEAFKLHSTLNIAGLGTSTVFNYTVPVGKRLEVLKLSYSGENRAIMKVYENTDQIDRKNLYFGELSGFIPMEGIEISAGDQLKVEFENTINETGDFTVTVYGRLI